MYASYQIIKIRSDEDVVDRCKESIHVSSKQKLKVRLNLSQYSEEIFEIVSNYYHQSDSIYVDEVLY